MSARARRLGTAALGTVAFFFLAFVQLPLFFRHFPGRPATADLFNYLAAAEVGRVHGWSRIYDVALQAPAYLHISGAPRFEWFDVFVSPPPVAWLAALFAPLGVVAAYWTWDALSLALLAVAAWRCSPWAGPGRIVALLVGFSLYPVLIALQFAQITPVLAACLGIAFVELRRGRDVAAALWLVPIVLKPQVGVLVPFALFLAGYRRCLLVWLAGAAAVTAVSLASIGGDGTRQLLADLAEEQRHLENQVWTLAWLVGVGPQTVIAEVVAVAAGLAAALRGGLRAGPGPALTAGALASLLGAGYHHSIDFPSVLVLGLIQLHTLRGWPAAVFTIAGVVACVVIPPVGPGPLLVFCVLWLLALAALAPYPRAAPGTTTTLPGASEA